MPVARSLILLALWAMMLAPWPAYAAAVEEGVRPWPRRDIPVWIHPDVGRAGRDRLLLRAMEDWNRRTGLRLHVVARPGRDTLHVFNRAKGARCDASVGYRPSFRREGQALSGAQMTLGACSYGSVLHELGHVLGLMHEHQRADRDRYLDFSPIRSVLSACAKGGALCDEALQNVGKPRRLRLSGPYDPCSLMHYLDDQSSKARSGRLPPSDGWRRWYLLTPAGEANRRLCRAKLERTEGCRWDRTGQKCQVTCQDANVVARFHGLKPRMACWAPVPTRAAGPR